MMLSLGKLRGRGSIAQKPEVLVSQLVGHLLGVGCLNKEIQALGDGQIVCWFTSWGKCLPLANAPADYGCLVTRHLYLCDPIRATHERRTIFWIQEIRRITYCDIGAY